MNKAKKSLEHRELILYRSLRFSTWDQKWRKGFCFVCENKLDCNLEYVKMMKTTGGFQPMIYIYLSKTNYTICITPTHETVSPPYLEKDEEFNPQMFVRKVIFWGDF